VLLPNAWRLAQQSLTHLGFLPGNHRSGSVPDYHDSARHAGKPGLRMTAPTEAIQSRSPLGGRAYSSFMRRSALQQVLPVMTEENVAQTSRTVSHERTT
jgi:hypothetical protein